MYIKSKIAKNNIRILDTSDIIYFISTFSSDLIQNKLHVICEIGKVMWQVNNYFV
jgi:hypothetical protein